MGDDWGRPDLHQDRWELACGALALASFEMGPDQSLRSTTELRQLCGLSPDQPLDRLADLLERVAVEERPAVLHTLTAPVSAGSTIELNVHLIRADGEMRSVTLRGKWVRGPGSPVLVAVALERPETEAQRLADLGQRYRSLAEVSPDIIVVHQDGVVVYANPATLQHLRARDASEVVGRSVLDFFTAESKRAFLNRVSTMEETGGIAAFFEERIVALDGTVIDIEATSIRTSWSGRPAYQAVARVITDRKAAERQLRYQAALIDTVSDAIIVCDGTDLDDMRVVSWSKGAESVYGYADEEAQGRLLSEVTGLNGSASRAWWAQVLRSGAGAYETTHVRRDGTGFPTHVSATLIRGDSGAPSGVITVSTDVSQRAAAETARRQLEERYSAVVAALEEGIILIGADGRIQAVNGAAERILDAPTEVLVGSRLADGPWVAVQEDSSLLPAWRWPPEVTLRTGQFQKNQVIGLVRSNATTWISVNCRPLAATTGPGCQVVCSLSDITAAKAAQDQLTHAATHDALTGLPNRAGITKHLARLAQENCRDVSVLFVDIDRFKDVNDSLGHRAGDELLCRLAARISKSVRANLDVVGRLAGDEFVVICRNLDRSSAVESLAARLLGLIQEPIVLFDSTGSERAVTTSASIGIAHLAEGASPESALVDADAAMYAAKENGRSRIEVFDEPLRQHVLQRLEIREDLRGALATHGLGLAYQPIVNPSGALTGYEALVRWDHPTRGKILPGEFIPVAEDTGLIVPLGAWVLAEAAATAAQWGASFDGPYVSVNLSTKQIADPGLVPMVKDILARTHLPPRSLMFEITESAVMRDAESAATILGALKSLGVMLAIDDFGTGYSSLAYLDKFPVDALKIDRSFVAMLTESALEPTLIAGIVSLAHSLNLVVIAEGVENEYQAETLIGLGVDALQGYLYGRPAPLKFVTGAPGGILTPPDAAQTGPARAWPGEDLVDPGQSGDWGLALGLASCS